MLYSLETMEGYQGQVRFRIDYLIAQQIQQTSLYTKIICSRKKISNSAQITLSLQLSK